MPQANVETGFHSPFATENLIESIQNAIARKRMIYFYYESQSFKGFRKVEPYILGKLENKSLAMRGYFIPNLEQKNEHSQNAGWKLYSIGKIDCSSFHVLEESFDYTRYAYNPADKSFIEIYCASKLHPRESRRVA